VTDDFTPDHVPFSDDLLIALEKIVELERQMLADSSYGLEDIKWAVQRNWPELAGELWFYIELAHALGRGEAIPNWKAKRGGLDHGR